MFGKMLIITLLGTLGCVLGNTLVARSVHQMLGMNHCTWGPSYWCSHIGNAKECGTMKHCAAVWETLDISGTSEPCSTCEHFVVGAQRLHEKKISAKEIGLYMDSLCYQLPGQVQKKCHDDVSNYLSEVFELLDLGVNALGVCHSIGLCHEIDTTKPPTTIGTTTTAPPPRTTTPSNKVCSDCTVFFNDVRQRLRANMTVQNVENLFDQTICATLGPFRSVCRQLVLAFVPVYLEDVSDFIDPDFICSILTFCPMSKKAAIAHALEAIAERNSLNMVNDKKECSNCKVFINNVKKEINSDTTVAKLKMLLEKDVCDHLGEYKSVCNMVVDTYADEILTDLLKNIDAVVVCREIGLCESQIVMNAVIARLEKVHFTSNNPFKESTECELCKVLLGELHSIIEDKKVQTAVIDFINNEVCSRLGEMKNACLTLVKEYEPLIMKAIQNLLDPSSGCTALGMCSNKSQTPSKSAIPMTPLLPGILMPYKRVGLVLPTKTKVKGISECDVCKMVMIELEKLLKDKSTQQEIEQALDEVCSILPGGYAKSCAKFVNTYTPGIIDLLLQEIKPSMVCSLLGLCESNAKLESSAVPDALGCSYCSEIIGMAAGRLQGQPDMTEKQFVAILLDLCNKHSDQFKYMCAEGVRSTGTTVYKSLKSGMSPREVCGLVGLCAASAVKPETQKYFTVMCELLKVTGLNANCKDFTEISKDINSHLVTIFRNQGAIKKQNALKTTDSSMSCGMCQTVVGYLEGFISSKNTEAEVRELLHKVCSYLGSTSLEKECDSIVDKYEDALVHLLIQELSPKLVCEELKLCKDTHTLYYKPHKLPYE